MLLLVQKSLTSKQNVEFNASKLQVRMEPYGLDLELKGFKPEEGRA